MCDPTSYYSNWWRQKCRFSRGIMVDFFWKQFCHSYLPVSLDLIQVLKLIYDLFFGCCSSNEFIPLSNKKNHTLTISYGFTNFAASHHFMETVWMKNCRQAAIVSCFFIHGLKYSKKAHTSIVGKHEYVFSTYIRCTKLPDRLFTGKTMMLWYKIRVGGTLSDVRWSVTSSPVE